MTLMVRSQPKAKETPKKEWGRLRTSFTMLTCSDLSMQSLMELKRMWQTNKHWNDQETSWWAQGLKYLEIKESRTWQTDRQWNGQENFTTNPRVEIHDYDYICSVVFLHPHFNTTEFTFQTPNYQLVIGIWKYQKSKLNGQLSWQNYKLE